jgi:MFS family permease
MTTAAECGVVAKTSPAQPSTGKPVPAASAAKDPAPQFLLATQLIFNLGFYSVIPFLAVSMREDFGVGALAIGIVLGARTFAQQGLFLVGGAMADRWGARRGMIIGCWVRIAGYLLLALASDFPLFLLGAVVSGIGGALFSPALESLVAQEERRANNSTSQKPNHFALLVIYGEIGAVAGPLLGAILLGIGFDTALLAGVGVFAAMSIVFHRFLPETSTQQREAVPASDLWSCLRDKRFLCFAAFFSVNLLAYNQLYFGLPVELERSGAGTTALAALFAYASVLTITLQWPIARLMRRTGAKFALTAGFALQAAGFASLSTMAVVPPPEAMPFLPAAVMVTALSLGHMCVAPVAMGLVLDFAAGSPTGAFYGLLSSCGGIAALVGNMALGPLYEHASAPSLAAAIPWLLLALLAATSALTISCFLPPRAAPVPPAGPQDLQRP